MSVFISHTTTDAANAYALSEWWRVALDYVVGPEDPNEPGHEECMIFSREGSHRLLFIEVPEPKNGKNRLHFDVRSSERDRNAEVDALIASGATLAADHRNADGSGWATLADPEGNEFCVLRSLAEVERGPRAN